MELAKTSSSRISPQRASTTFETTSKAEKDARQTRISYYFSFSLDFSASPKILPLSSKRQVIQAQVFISGKNGQQCEIAKRNFKEQRWENCELHSLPHLFFLLYLAKFKEIERSSYNIFIYTLSKPKFVCCTVSNVNIFPPGAHYSLARRV